MASFIFGGMANALMFMSGVLVAASFDHLTLQSQLSDWLRAWPIVLLVLVSALCRAFEGALKQ